MIDPITGQEIPEQTPTQPQTVAVPAEEWAAMKAKLDMFDRMGAWQNNQPPVQQVDPNVELDKQLDAIDADIDQAIQDGRSVKALQRKRDALVQAKTDLRISAAIDPIRTSGMTAIDQLSGEVYKSQMPYLETVKKDYESNLSKLPLEMRMSSEGKKMAYNLAVGTNVDKIRQLEVEKLQRQAASQNLGTSGSPAPKKDPDVPDPKDVLNQKTLADLRAKGQTADDFYRSVGYQGGWNEYFKKNKSYYVRKGIVAA